MQLFHMKWGILSTQSKANYYFSQSSIKKSMHLSMTPTFNQSDCLKKSLGKFFFSISSQ